MGTGNNVKTDLYGLYNYVQNTMISYPKELFIETLREFFSADSYYAYHRDEWGFPKTPDHTDLPSHSGLSDNVTTRLFIGEAYRYDVIYYPALIIRNAGSRSVPLSMSRDKGSLQWQDILFVDGYGNEKIFQIPSYFVQSGAWEGSVTVDIETRSPRARDELADLVSLVFVDTRFEDMKNSGVVIKSGSPTAGSPSETDDRNDKLFKQTITFEIRSEWRRHIPVNNVVEVINVCADVGNLAHNPPAFSPNLKISTTVELLNNLQEL
jgi:hypothetical protein